MPTTMVPSAAVTVAESGPDPKRDRDTVTVRPAGTVTVDSAPAGPLSSNGEIVTLTGLRPGLSRASSSVPPAGGRAAGTIHSAADAATAPTVASSFPVLSRR